MLTIPRSIHFTPEEFAELCIANPDAVLELSAEGELEQMTPTSSETGERNADLNFQLSLWNRQTRLGRVFDSSAGFRLPNGAIRSPDAAWIANERWERLTPDARQGFAQICPDFVIELASPTDQLPRLQRKLTEYLANGTRLGWLINPAEKTVQVYRAGRESEVIDQPNRLSGEAVLPDFVLDLMEIFDSP